ncbi:MAG: hypothetical protein AABY78_00260 [Nitrospirota bacterium]
MKGFIVVVVTFIVISVLVIAEGAPPPPSTEKSQSTSIQQIPSLVQTKPKKPLNIKLKRNSKDDYSWEINGENVQDIINADRKLRKGLGFE